MGALSRADKLIKLDLDGSVSRFWVFWMRNTIRNVTIVVVVLITNCQVSLKPNSGPVTSQPRISTTANVKTGGWPQKREDAFAKREYQDALRIPRPSGLASRTRVKPICLADPTTMAGGGAAGAGHRYKKTRSKGGIFGATH